MCSLLVYATKPSQSEKQKRAGLSFLKDKKLKQREISSLLGIAQPEVSHLLNGHCSRFTTDKLLDFLKRPDQKVTVRIHPHKPGEPYQEVGFTP